MSITLESMVEELSAIAETRRRTHRTLGFLVNLDEDELAEAVARFVGVSLLSSVQGRRVLALCAEIDDPRWRFIGLQQLIEEAPDFDPVVREPDGTTFGEP